LSLASDLWRLKRIVSNARVSQALLTSRGGREVSVASGLEEGQSCGRDSVARIWSRLLNNRVKRNWRRGREEIRTVLSGRRRARKNGSLSEDGLTLSEDTHRHLRDRERRELESGELGSVEVTIASRVVSWLFALGRINSNLVVEVVG